MQGKHKSNQPHSLHPATPRTVGHVSEMITVRGAHLHNLRNVDVDIPRGQLVAVAGISGSGKSSLAFGTIHGEGQRRYFESVAPFARRLIGSATDPQVDAIEGLPPTVALQQNTSAGGARSTVGTVSTMSNTVRLLYSRAGDYPAGVSHMDSDHFSPNTTAGMCPRCQGTGTEYVATEASMIPDPTLSIDDGAIAAWPGAWAGKNFHDILQELGFPLDIPWRDIPRKQREWILYTEEQPVVTIYPVRGKDQVQKTYEGTWRSVSSYLNKTLAETESDTLRKRTLGFMEARRCPLCEGRRLIREALEVRWAGLPIDELGALSLTQLREVTAARHEQPASEAERLLLDALAPILDSAVELGLGHLSLDRPARTLSGGETQRLRLASQLKTGLFGVAYVLDEPTAGLHPAEREAVFHVVRTFVEQGNTVLLVEHDMDLVARCDWIVDVGPGAGEGGGKVLFSGPVADYLKADIDSPTHRELTRSEPLTLNATPRTPTDMFDVTVDERFFDNVRISFGAGQFTVVAGVSGAGKTTLLGAVEKQVERPLLITQDPIGRTPRSCVATYTGFFDDIRRLFARTDEAKRRGWGVSRFSYNVKEGQCPTCSGEGQIEVELVFLPGSYTTCPTCKGARYTEETLQVRWNGLTIADVLALTVDEAREVFAGEKKIARALQTLFDVGLGYLRLGQGAPELSGGEAQRIKVSRELARSRRGHTVYLLDEPSTGLHPFDTAKLIERLQELVDAGASVIVAEHNLAALAAADRIIEVGPGAGAAGGRIIADASPADLAGADTPTGRALGC